MRSPGLHRPAFGKPLSVSPFTTQMTGSELMRHGTPVMSYALAERAGTAEPSRQLLPAGHLLHGAGGG